MKLYVYVDESGTFDKSHNELFVYGGIVVMGTEAKDNLERKYQSIENRIRSNLGVKASVGEMKASKLPMHHRKRLFHAADGLPCRRFGVVVNQRLLDNSVFLSKGAKQRYLDWALKIGIKRCVLKILKDGDVKIDSISKMAVYVDEHSSSTTGRYNLEETINEEFRFGVYNPDLNIFYEPIFSPKFPAIPVRYLNSEKVPLIRAADVTANWVYCAARDQSEYPFEWERVQTQVVMYSHPLCFQNCV